MFGYVVVEKPSLRLREYDYYRATYCGLCHAMGKCTGCASRLTLSYDMTFFALIREMLEGEEVLFVKKRCPRHPIKKIETVEINSQLEYSAYVGGILTAGKIEDNINDEKGAKRAIASFLRLFLSKMEREADKNLPEISYLVEQKLSELKEVETNMVRSIDVPADIFGDMMGSLLSYGLDGDKKLVASNIGKRIGRWIYIVDAFDDYDKDRKLADMTVELIEIITVDGKIYEETIDAAYTADDRSRTMGIVLSSASGQRVVDYGVLENPEPGNQEEVDYVSAENVISGQAQSTALVYNLCEDDYDILLRIVGITYISDLTSGICKECGYGVLAGQVAVAGKMGVLFL